MSAIKNILGVTLILVSIGLCKAQTKPKTIDAAEAKEHFSKRNYLFAMRLYTELVKKEPNNIDYNYKLALCYLNTNISKKQAVQYLEVVTKHKDADNETWFDLG